MRIIKLNAIDSTNSFLKKLYNNEAVKDYTVVMAKVQTKGRGQRETVWDAETGKNLTFSVFKGLVGLQIEHAFFVSIITSLAIVKALESFNIPKLKIKWPNDILSDNKKICGILIENVIKNNQLDSCIIGIGLNVNQTQFNNLPKASSIKQITGVTYDLDELLHAIIKNLELKVDRLRAGNRKELKADYESYLFRNNKPSTFKNAEGKLFSGFIKGVSNSGKLNVLLEDKITKEFDLKEITLMF